MLWFQDGAKTLEEIEQNLMDGSNVQHQLSSKLPSHALTVEELERQLRGEDAAACGNDFHDANHLSGAQHAHGMNVVSKASELPC
jgi:acid phosphatase class B